MMIVTYKYFGYISRENTAYYGPSSWDEIIEEMPGYVITALIGAIVAVFLCRGIEKNKEKAIDETQKRTNNSKEDKQDVKNKSKNNKK